MKQSGAFEMAMKGRGDASLGRCEERGERWTVRAEKQGKHESKNGLGQEKGNVPINCGCCLTGPPPPSVPAAIDVHLGSTQPPSLQQHPLLLPRTLRATGGCIHSSMPLITMAMRAAQAPDLTFQGSLYYLGTSPLVCCALKGVVRSLLCPHHGVQHKKERGIHVESQQASMGNAKYSSHC